MIDRRQRKNQPSFVEKLMLNPKFELIGHYSDWSSPNKYLHIDGIPIFSDTKSVLHPFYDLLCSSVFTHRSSLIQSICRSTPKKEKRSLSSDRFDVQFHHLNTFVLSLISRFDRFYLVPTDITIEMDAIRAFVFFQRWFD